MTVGGLAGGAITSQPELATAPIAAMFLGTAAGTSPASHLMAVAGRRPGFMLGAAFGVLGGRLAALGVWLTSMPLLALGTFFVGVYQCFAQFYRFAASEAADVEFRPRAISLVLAGGIVAAFLGPVLGRIGGALIEPTYVGSFLLLSCVSLVGLAVLSRLHMPAQVADTVDTSRGPSLVENRCTADLSGGPICSGDWLQHHDPRDDGDSDRHDTSPSPRSLVGFDRHPVACFGNVSAVVH